jgi:hypothetical protein
MFKAIILINKIYPSYLYLNGSYLFNIICIENRLIYRCKRNTQTGIRGVQMHTKTDQTLIKTYQDRPDPYQNLPRHTRPIPKTYQDRPDPYQNLPRQTRPISKLTKTDQTHIKTYQDRPDPYKNLILV